MCCHALLEQGTRSGVLALAARYQPENKEGGGNAFHIVHLPCDRQSFLRHGACCGHIALRPGHAPQHRERKCYAWLVFEFPIQCQALLKQRLRTLIVALDESQVRCNQERFRVYGCLDLGTRNGYPYGQCTLQEIPPFTNVPMDYPESS